MDDSDDSDSSDIPYEKMTEQQKRTYDVTMFQKNLNR